MKKAVGMILLVSVFFTFLFSGCGSKLSLRKGMLQPGQLRMVTQCVPRTSVKVYHSGGELAAITNSYGTSLLSVIAKPFTDITVKDWEMAVEKEIFSAGAPRFYEAVMEKSAEKISRQIPDWEPMIVDDQGVSPETVKSLLRDPGPLLVLACGASYSKPPLSCAPGLSTAHGLESRYYARLYLRGQLVLEKSLKYESDHEPSRYRKIEEFSVDNWKLLKEEMEYAADVISTRLVKDLMIEIRRAE